MCDCVPILADYGAEQVTAELYGVQLVCRHEDLTRTIHHSIKAGTVTRLYGEVVNEPG